MSALSRTESGMAADLVPHGQKRHQQHAPSDHRQFVDVPPHLRPPKNDYGTLER